MHMIPRVNKNERMSDVLIFITATIQCGETPHVKRRDPEQRKQDYLQAFRAWLSQDCNADILFCENSNADLSTFRELAAAQRSGYSVRVVSFLGNSGAQEKGKGHGEIEMLQYAFVPYPS